MPAPHHTSFYGPDALSATHPTASKTEGLVIKRNFKSAHSLLLNAKADNHKTAEINLK